MEALIIMTASKKGLGFRDYPLLRYWDLQGNRKRSHLQASVRYLDSRKQMPRILSMSSAGQGTPNPKP